MRPLEGIRVIDFSTLLPGPLATLILAEAGAEVFKIERPPIGDEMRGYCPRVGAEGLMFAQLNRGKRSIAIDLKAEGAVERLTPLMRSADVLVEQFRPGVMKRLGLDYEAVQAINPQLVYCSLSGYGRNGPKADKAAHDLNYVAESGMLSIVPRTGEAPTLPPALLADIGAGAYPAVINILLGLLGRQTSGNGCFVDVSMYDNVLPFMYSAVGAGLGLGRWPVPGGELLSGASARYNLYRTCDGRHVAAAPLEQRFWEKFCAVISLPAAEQDDTKDPAATVAKVAEIIGAQSAEHWQKVFDGVDACVSVVSTLEEGLCDPHYRARGVYAHSVTVGGHDLPAAPVPVDAAFRSQPSARESPVLGEANALLDAPTG